MTYDSDNPYLSFLKCHILKINFPSDTSRLTHSLLHGVVAQPTNWPCRGGNYLLRESGVGNRSDTGNVGIIGEKFM